MSEFMNNNIFDLSTIIDQEPEFIPLISEEEEEKMNQEEVPEELPILTLRNNALFPGVVIPITVGRDKSIKLIEDAYAKDKTIGVVSQIKSEIEEPTIKDLHKIGTVAHIIKKLKMPDGSTTIIIQGKRRFEIESFTQEKPYFRALVKGLTETKLDMTVVKNMALLDSMKEMALKIIKESPSIPSEASFAIKNIESPTFLVNFIASNLSGDVEKKQALLQTDDIQQRIEQILAHLSYEIKMLSMKNEIQSKVKVDLDQQQREYFLNQQIKTIQEELGDNPGANEIIEFEKRAAKKKWSKATKEAYLKEIKKFKRMNPQGAEYSVQLNYIDLILDLPWKKNNQR